MGTSTDYSGGPNWKSSKNETTRAGGNASIDPDKAASIVAGIVEQMAETQHLGFGEALSGGYGSGVGGGGTGRRRGGGRGGGGGGGGGGTMRVGGSARTVARGLGSFLAEVRSRGFRASLVERGLTDLEGKSVDEIAFELADILGGPSSLIEQTALRDALTNLVLDWSEGETDIDGLGESVGYAASNIEETLQRFLGYYIFEVFKTVGYKGVLEAHGFEKAEKMTREIHDYIVAEIADLESTRELTDIDWNGREGAETVNEIVADTIAIFGEAEL